MATKPRKKPSTPAHRVDSQPQARPVYPFTGIVGQEEMKLSLVLNVIDPHIGGVLVMGHRGTGKSTTIRALANLLPQVTKVKGCPYNCDPNEPALLCGECSTRRRKPVRLLKEQGSAPVVELPLGATEDRVCGTLDIERALLKGRTSFQPGLLARANRGFLYIDEVNLLEDHLVDLLLDVAASGQNIVEREGISISHPARFVLVGSGNPEEGELRPQLLDRFGLHAKIETITDIEDRIEIIKRREFFEQDPIAFCVEMEQQQAQLREQICAAQRLINRVTISDELLRQIAVLCLQLNVDGHRGELTIVRSAKALAAYNRRIEVSPEDIQTVAVMSLRHRLRKDPMGEVDPGTRVERALEDLFPSTPPKSGTEIPEETIIEAVDSELPDAVFPPVSKNKPNDANRLTPRKGGRSEARTRSRGRYVGSIPGAASKGKIAVDATLRATALNKLSQPPSRSDSISLVSPNDIRLKRLKQKAGMLIVFVVDASGSMALNRINQAKGAVTRLLQQAYLHRDKVALISFRGEGAEIVLPPSRSVERAKRAMDALPVGGSTPLTTGLLKALDLIRRGKLNCSHSPMMVLITDGRANVPIRNQTPETRNENTLWEELRRVCSILHSEDVASVVLDTQNQYTTTGEGQRLAELLGGRYIHLPRPNTNAVYHTVTQAVEAARISS